jgi:hypothetical protein
VPKQATIPSPYGDIDVARYLVRAELSLGGKELSLEARVADRT